MREDVKDLLERAVGWYEPATIGISGLERRAANERRRARIAATVVALAVFAGSAGLVWNAFRTSSGVPADGVNGVFFPRLTESSNVYMAALAQGTLLERRGCLVLSGSDGTRILLIWPQEARVETTSSGGLEVFFGDQPYGATGDSISIGGGYVSQSRDDVSLVEALIGEPIPVRCRADGYWSAAPPGPLTGAATPIEVAMLAAAQRGEFPLPAGTEATYTGGVECRVDRPGSFHGEDVYLCAFNLSNGARQFEWGALLDGQLHTHATDPALIPTITGPWDPPW